MIGKFLLRLFYEFVKASVKAALFAFYPDTTVVGRKYLREQGPNILVSNHPNTLLDPMHAASRVKQQVYFLANSGLFDTPFKEKLLRTLYCIPVVRKQDTSGRHISNKDSFASAIAFLSKGGCLYVAPEGTSIQERHLRSVKSGTARIALATEAAHDFKLGLTIRTVGLTYEKPHHPFTHVMVRAGEPIRVADFGAAYQENPRAAATALTEQLRARLSSLIIDTDNAAQDQLLHQLETLQQSEAPLDAEAHYQRARATLAELKALPVAEHEALVAKGQTYFGHLEAAHTSDKAVKQSRLPWGHAFLLLLSLPVFLYGWLNHLILWYLPRTVLRKVNPDISYWSTLQWMLLMVLFPIVYALQCWGVHTWLGAPWIWIYLGSLLMTGPLAVAWHQAFLRWRKHWAFARLSAEKRKELQTARRLILDAMN